jgi:hypothetical protein
MTAKLQTHEKFYFPYHRDTQALFPAVLTPKIPYTNKQHQRHAQTYLSLNAIAVSACH